MVLGAALQRPYDGLGRSDQKRACGYDVQVTVHVVRNLSAGNMRYLVWGRREAVLAGWAIAALIWPFLAD